MALLLVLAAFVPAEAPPVAWEDDRPPMALLEPQKTTRVQLHGLWYDRSPDGTLEYCKECNRGKAPPAGSAVSVREHEALLRYGFVLTQPAAVPGVTAQLPFVSVTPAGPSARPATSTGAPIAGGRSVPLPVGRGAATFTPASVVTFGNISRPCYGGG